MNTRPGPEPGSTPNAKHDGKITRPAIRATSVSSPATRTASPVSRMRPCQCSCRKWTCRPMPTDTVKNAWPMAAYTASANVASCWASVSPANMLARNRAGGKTAGPSAAPGSVTARTHRASKHHEQRHHHDLRHALDALLHSPARVTPTPTATTDEHVHRHLHRVGQQAVEHVGHLGNVSSPTNVPVALFTTNGQHPAAPP